MTAPDPKDLLIFGPNRLALIQKAVDELSWLLSRGYKEKSACKLVGDRYQLTKRQRHAIRRAACTDQARKNRRTRRLLDSNLPEKAHIDSFNILITLEQAYSKNPLIRCREGVLRDLAGVHGSYKSISRTPEAIDLVGEHLRELGVKEQIWLLDRPVSNSGKLAALLRDKGCHTEIVDNPDRNIVDEADLAISSDGWVLDHARGWFPLVERIIKKNVPDAWIVDLQAR